MELVLMLEGRMGVRLRSEEGNPGEGSLEQMRFGEGILKGQSLEERLKLEVGSLVVPRRSGEVIPVERSLEEQLVGGR